MTEVYLEALDTRETLSGVEIAEDLANCLVEGLRNNADLRPTDAFSGYAAKIKVELQLQDVDRITVSQIISVDTLNSEIPATTVEIVVPQADALTVRERSGIEPPDFTKEGSALPVKPKRWYTPRTPHNKDFAK